MKSIPSSLLVLLICLCFQFTSLFAQVQQPNIVFILADDLGYGDLGCYGSTQIKTPHIDALAKNGVRFSDCYAGSTVCAPSRAALMTGRHTGQSYIRGNGEVPLREKDTILPQLLKTVGYKNGMVGKWGLGQQGTAGAPELKGWDFFSGLLHHVEGHYQLPDSAWQMINGKSQRIKIPGNKFSNEWFKDEAIRFIQDNKQEPFFLYVAFTLPHAELLAPQQFLHQYLNEDGKSKFGPETPNKSNLHYGVQEFPKAAYAAMVSQMDNYVGEITAKLQALGMMNNTIIIFTSDNGTHVEGGRTKNDVSFFKSSGNLKGVKRDLYEGGIRVPFIMQWNNSIAKQSTNTTPIAFWDMLPSFAAIAGVNTAFQTDGMAVLNNTGKEALKKERVFYWEFYENGFKQAIRFGKWKAIRFYQGAKPVRTELYNLDDDVSEKHNVATQHIDVVLQLENYMDAAHSNAEHPKFQIK